MAKLRNVLIAAISSLLLLGGGVAVYGTSQVHATEQQFVASGYILDGAEDRENGYAKLSFEAGTTYRTGYPDRVIFKDTAGIEVATDKTTFLHYSDGSLSALTDGVIVDLNNMSGGMLNNYRINAGTVLERRDSSYVIDSMSGTLYLDDFIWKISDTQYMLVSSTIDVAVGSQEPMYFDDAVELRYYNEGIMMLVTEAGAYRTVATDCAATVNSGITLDLASRTIVTDEEGTKMSMEQIILDADEVIDVLSPIMSAQKSDDLFERNQLNEAVKIAMPTFEVIDGEDGEDGEAGEDGQMGEQGAIGQSGLTGADGLAGENGENGKGGLDGIEGADGAGGAPGAPGDPGTAGISGTNGKNGQNGKAGAKGAQGVQGIEGRSGDDILKEQGVTGELPLQVVLPVFSFVNMEYSSDSVTTDIAYTEPSAGCTLYTDSIVVSLIRTADGREVGQKLAGIDFDASGSPFSLDGPFTNLIPEQEYTLQVTASYMANNTTYTKVFATKSFFTDSLGVSLDLVYATEDKLAFMPEKTGYSTVDTASVTLVDPMADSSVTPPTKQVTFGQEVVFEGLQSNHAYVVQFTNIGFSGVSETRDSYGKKTYYTLKKKPLLGNPEVIVNKVDGTFIMRLASVTDEDNGILDYRYEIYEVGNEDSPVKVVTTSTAKEVICPVVGELERGRLYRLRIVACFNDNEKMVEYTSIDSGAFIMDGKGYPIVSFERDDGQHDYITGALRIDTNGASIEATEQNPLIVKYTSSTGKVGTAGSYTVMPEKLPSTESDIYDIPVSLSGLKGGDSYVLSIHGSLNVGDTQGTVHNALIGQIVVGTEPIPQLRVTIGQAEGVNKQVAFKVGIDRPDNTGTIQSNEISDHAAHTATTMRINVRNGGDKNSPVVATYDVTNGYDPAYRTTGGLYDTIYNGSTVTITEDELRLDPNLLTQGNYTVEIVSVTDYTEYANKFVITNPEGAFATYGKAAVRPDDKTFIDMPLSVFTIRNAQAESFGGTVNSNLTPDAIVGYRLSTYYGQLTGQETAVYYYAYEAKNIAEQATAAAFYSNYGSTAGIGECKMSKQIPVGATSEIPGHVVWLGDATSGGENMSRGSKYIFTVQIEITENDTTAIFPNESLPVAKSEIYETPYITPTVRFLPWSIEPNLATVEYRYTIEAKDPDAVGTSFESIGAGTLDAATASTRDGEGKVKSSGSVKLTGASGQVRVQCMINQFKTIYETNMQDVINYYVSSTNTTNAGNSLRYAFEHDVDRNRLHITVNDNSDSGSFIKQIAGLQIEFYNSQGQALSGVPAVNVAWNEVSGTKGEAYVYYSELSPLKDDSTNQMKLVAIFDTEQAGYSLVADQAARVAIQAVVGTGRGNYVIPNPSGTEFTLSSTDLAVNSWYTVGSGNPLEGRMPSFHHELVNGFSGTMGLVFDRAGVRLSVLPASNYVVLKELTGIDVKHTDGSNMISLTFGNVRPTINLNKGQFTYTIDPTVDTARVHFILNGHASHMNDAGMDRDTTDGNYYIYMDLYEVTGINATKIREACAKVPIEAGKTQYTDDGETPLITGLDPGKKYGITLYYKLNGTKIYPLDVNRPEYTGESIMFTFTTLGNISISAGAASYDAERYNEKYIRIPLYLTTILGYDIAYELVKSDSANPGQYITLLDSVQLADKGIIEKTTQLTNTQTEIKLNANPGQIAWEENGNPVYFGFGDTTLFLKVTPVSEQNEAIAVGDPCYVALNIKEETAFFGYRIKPKSETEVNVTITAHDPNRVIAGDAYMIRIFNGDEDVTPTDYKGAPGAYTKFSTSGNSRTFKFTGLQQGVIYTIKLYAELDMKNVGMEAISEATEENCRDQRTVTTLSPAGFDFGEMTLVNTSMNRLAIYFTNHVNLQEKVKYINYMVVAPNGNVASDELDMENGVGFQTMPGDEDTVFIDLAPTFESTGRYTIQLRFFGENHVSLNQDMTLTYIKGY